MLQVAGIGRGNRISRPKILDWLLMKQVPWKDEQEQKRENNNNGGKQAQTDRGSLQWNGRGDPTYTTPLDRKPRSSDRYRQ